MNCPYRDFQECIVEKCPSCNYKENKRTVIEGRYPSWMDSDTAIKRGCAWEATKTSYEFISCKLLENNVQPVPSKKEIVNQNITNETCISIKKSIF